jgi:hypothetical protein
MRGTHVTKETTMSTSDIRNLLAEMHQWLERLESCRPADVTPAASGSHELGAQPDAMPPVPCSLELDETASPAADLSPPYHVGHFDARHKLTPEQAWLAEQLLRRKPPFRGPHAQPREARRRAGIISAVRNGRVSSTHWGHRMLAKRGGLALAAHAPHILQANREGILARRHALKAVQQRQPQTPFEAWQQSLTDGPATTGQHDLMTY